MKALLIFFVATIFSFSAFAEGDKTATNKEQKTENVKYGITLPSQAQENNVETKGLPNNTDIKEWFLGASFGHARMKNDEGAFIMGLQGGWIFNQRFVIGAAGYGFMNGGGGHDHNNDGIMGGYGGLLLAPVFWGARTVHLSLPILLGGGGISNDSYDNYNDPINSGYFIFVPGVELEVNITNHFRIAGSFVYRITSNQNWKGMEPGYSSPGSNFVNGPSVNLIFKFGKFHSRK